MAEQFANDYVTALDGAINDSVTSLVVDGTPPLAADFRIRIDDELMLVTGVAGSTLTVTRGIEGSTPAAHADNAVVSHVLTADALRIVSGRVNATLVQQGNKVLNNVSPASIVLGATPTVGNVLFCLTGISDGNSVTPSQTNVTWTNVADIANGAVARASIWKGVIGASAGTTVTLTRGAGTQFWQAWVGEFSGIDGTVTATATGTTPTGSVEGTPALLVSGDHIFLYTTGQATGGSGTVFSPIFTPVPSLGNSGFMGYRLMHRDNDPVGGLSLMGIARASASALVAVT